MIALYLVCIVVALLIFALLILIDHFMQSHTEYQIIAPRYRRQR